MGMMEGFEDLLDASFAPCLREWIGEKGIEPARVEYLQDLCGIASAAEKRVGAKTAAEFLGGEEVVTGEQRRVVQVGRRRGSDVLTHFIC